MVAVVVYEFGIIEIHSNFVLAVMNEGVTVKPKYNKELVKIAKKYFKNRSFGYITHRKNSYSVDPKIYIETSKIENLVAFAVVSVEEISLSNTQVEKIFLTKPFGQFTTLEEAEQWVEKVIAEAQIS